MRQSQPLQLFCVILLLVASLCHAQMPHALDIALESQKASVRRDGFFCPPFPKLRHNRFRSPKRTPLRLMEN